MQDRRRHKRISKSYIAWLRFADESQKNLDNAMHRDWDMVSVYDLSAGGISLCYNRAVALEAIIQLRIKFPFKSKAIDCTGRLSRSASIDNSSLHRIAARFECINESDKSLIDSVADSMCSDQ
jgi:hypothetical protein